MHDLIIVGAGPAGISAALTAQARGVDFLWCGAGGLGGKIRKAERVMNYPGLSAVTGEELHDRFLRQLDESGISIQTVRADAVYPMGGSYAVCSGEEILEGTCLLLATGVSGSRAIPGESRLMGKGVSCCATCDGALYRGKEIAVICTDPNQEEEIEFLAKLAGKVTLFTSYRSRAAERINIAHYTGTPSEIVGDDRAEAVLFGGERIAVDGVFCLRESVSPAVLLPGLAVVDSHIQTDQQQRTNLPGCFAAGDCTGRPYQYAKAVGEGNVAVHSVVDYLKTLRTTAAG